MNNLNTKMFMKFITLYCIGFVCLLNETLADTMGENGLIIKTKCVNSSVIVNKVNSYHEYCGCEYSCFVPDSKNLSCIALSCTGYNKELGHCVWKSEDKTISIVLQAIPFTGTSGISWGILRRWDIVTLIWAPIGVYCLLGCFITCFLDCFSQDDEEKKEHSETFVNCFSNCFGCLWALLLLSLWIYGIVALATGDIKDGDGCFVLSKNTVYKIN